LIFIQPAFGNSVIALLVWLTTLFIIIPNQAKTIAFLILIMVCLITYLQIFNIQMLNNDFVIAWARDGGFGMIIGIIGLIGAYLIVAWMGKFDFRLLIALPLITLLVLLSGLFAWNNYVRDYQKQRVLTYIEGPGANYNKEGYQIGRSVVAIGSGRLFGRGYLLGVQSGLKYLPEAHTDFIFAAYVEQFGLVGALVLFFLYLFLILRVIRISRESAGDFGRIIALGTAILLLLHVFISIGMNLGQLPVTGIPLPLMSYGGSAVLMIMICLGLVQAVNSNKKAVDIADNSMVLSRSLLLKNK
jgi:rod shape determining protein RodA